MGWYISSKNDGIRLGMIYRLFVKIHIYIPVGELSADGKLGNVKEKLERAAHSYLCLGIPRWKVIPVACGKFRNNRIPISHIILEIEVGWRLLDTNQWGLLFALPNFPLFHQHWMWDKSFDRLHTLTILVRVEPTNFWIMGRIFSPLPMQTIEPCTVNLKLMEQEWRSI